MIKVISSIEEFHGIEAVWNQLYLQAINMTPFQSFMYNYLSWTVYMKNAGCLYIIECISDKDKKLKAIFPCYIDKNNRLRFINDRDTDFCNAVIDKNADDYRLFEELSEFLKEEKRIKSVRWDNLEYNNHLKAVFLPFFKVVYLHDINAYSKMSIYPLDCDKSFFDSIRHINGQRRKKLSKVLLQERNLQFLFLQQSAGHSFPESEVRSLVNIMVSNQIRRQEYFSEEMILFWIRMYETGLLTVALLYQDNVIKSVNFMFYNQANNEYIKWIMLYADKRYNLIINLKLIEYLYNHGGAVINFARGIYDYKMVNYHPKVFCLYRLEMEKTNSSALTGLITINKYYMKKIVKSIIRK